MHISSQMKLWRAQQRLRSCFRRRDRGAALVAFSGSREDLIALHLCLGLDADRLTVLELRPTPQDFAMAAFIDDLRLRWSLGQRCDWTTHVLPEGVSPDACDPEQLASASRRLGANVIIRGRRRTAAETAAHLVTATSSSEISWLYPLWLFDDDDVERCLRLFEIPAPAEVEPHAAMPPGDDAVTDDVERTVAPPALPPEMAKRLRGLGYF